MITVGHERNATGMQIATDRDTHDFNNMRNAHRGIILLKSVFKTHQRKSTHSGVSKRNRIKNKRLVHPLAPTCAGGVLGANMNFG